MHKLTVDGWRMYKRVCCAGGQVGVAEEYSERLRGYQEDMPTAAYGDATREWTHLVLTKARLILVAWVNAFLAQSCHGGTAACLWVQTTATVHRGCTVPVQLRDGPRSRGRVSAY